MECQIPTGGVYPIATANDKNRISEPLISRFAVIDIPDYTSDEKKIIFRDYSMPKVLRRMGMRKEECRVTQEAVDAISICTRTALAAAIWNRQRSTWQAMHSTR